MICQRPPRSPIRHSSRVGAGGTEASSADRPPGQNGDRPPGAASGSHGAGQKRLGQRPDATGPVWESVTPPDYRASVTAAPDEMTSRIAETCRRVRPPGHTAGSGHWLSAAPALRQPVTLIRREDDSFQSSAAIINPSVHRKTTLTQGRPCALLSTWGRTNNQTPSSDQRRYCGRPPRQYNCLPSGADSVIAPSVI